MDKPKVFTLVSTFNPELFLSSLLVFLAVIQNKSWKGLAETVDSRNNIN